MTRRDDSCRWGGSGSGTLDESLYLGRTDPLARRSYR